MAERLLVTYSIMGSDVREMAEAIRVEQSIEFPFALAQEWIQDTVVGQIEEISNPESGASKVKISYDTRIVGGELPQLLNVLWGNVSILPGVKITDIEIPNEILSKFKGPRFGISGLRDLLDAPSRPLASTALKPMGSSSKEFANMAYILAKAGFDTIKDDHSLANQPWSLWRERVELVAQAVSRANSETGGRTIYAPSLNLPADRIFQAAAEAKALGAGALMVLPGISGLDTMRVIAEDDNISLPIMSHPSLMGSLVTSASQGVGHGILFGTLVRLAGADISIFPNFGGRFSFSKQECLEIASCAKIQMGNMKATWVSPAGGMTVEKLPAMIDHYGRDTAALIGGALHNGDLAINAQEMVSRISKL